MVLVQNRALCGATARKLEVWHLYASLIRRVLRTRYAAPIGIVDTPGGLAGLVLPLTNVLCIGIPVMLWVISELRFSTKESDEIASFVIEDFYAACGNL